VTTSRAAAPIKIGTRSSELALRQARLVQEALAARGVASELKTYRTVGDKRLDESLSSIGAKGLFTKELEVDLLKGKTQLAVHSLKDLPTDSPDGLMVAAVLEREDPRDVLVVNGRIDAASLAELPRGSRVGTSSLRRRAQLLAMRSDLEVAELRGNVPTRLKKIDEGRVHAAILAAAGLHRLGAHQHITCYLDAPAWLPAAGQGAIAVQVRADDARMLALASAMNDPSTMRAVQAERAFLAALEGGCQVPIGAVAMPGTGAGGAVLYGLIADIEGSRVVRGSIQLDPNDPALSGIRLANKLRGEGATEILEGLRRAVHLPSPQPE
jgi:hydroxymethylbilane synthase